MTNGKQKCLLISVPVAEFIDPWLGDKVNSGIGLSHRPANRYDNSMPELTLSPQSGIYEFGYGPRISQKFVSLSWISRRIEFFEFNLKNFILEKFYSKPKPNTRFCCTVLTKTRTFVSPIHISLNCSLKGLSHEIDFKTFDKNLQNLA